MRLLFLKLYFDFIFPLLPFLFHDEIKPMQEAKKKKKSPAENTVSPFFRVLPCKVNICAEGWTTPVQICDLRQPGTVCIM